MSTFAFAPAAQAKATLPATVSDYARGVLGLFKATSGSGQLSLAIVPVIVFLVNLALGRWDVTSIVS